MLKMRRDRVMQTALRGEGFRISEKRIHEAYLKVEPGWVRSYGSQVLRGREAEAAYQELDVRVLEEIRVGGSTADRDGLAARIRERWDEVDSIMKPVLYPESVPLLRRLKREGFVLGLISNAPPNTEQTVAQLGLNKYLDPVVISGILGYAKPNPLIFQHAMKLASVRPRESMHVGDLYDTDIVGARSAGMTPVMIDRDKRTVRAEFAKISRLDELTQMLDMV